MSSKSHAQMTDEEFEKTLEAESFMFEQELNSSDAPQDPKERARLRHLHYTKQSEKHVERMRALGTIAKKKEREVVSGSTVNRMKKKCSVEYINKREFEAHGAQKTYGGPLITEEYSTLLEEQDGIVKFVDQQQQISKIVKTMNSDDDQSASWLQQYPVFLGEDGTLYDKNYLPVLRQDPEHLSSGRGKFSRVQKETLGQSFDDTEELNTVWDEYEYCHDPDLYNTSPNPYSYETFDEYEHAMLKWCSDVQSRLGYLQLPVPMGRHYYRPYVQSDNDENAKLKRSSSKQVVAASDSYSLIEGDETWESNLVPMEPKPEFYDTYEEYEKAMVRWTIQCLGLPVLPPHPAQFQKLLGLRLVDPPIHAIAGVEVNLSSSKKKSNENDDEEEHEISKQTVTRGRNDKRRKKRRRRLSDADHVYRDNEDHLLYRNSDEWNKLSSTNREGLMNAVTKVHKEHFDIFIEHGVFHIQSTPKIHGIFQPENDRFMRVVTECKMENDKDSKKSPQNVNEWVIQQRKQRSASSSVSKSSSFAFFESAEGLLHQQALRRVDYSEEQLKAAHDCNAVEQDKPVTFKVPDFDIGQINVSNLKEPSYVRFLQNLLKRLDYSTRYNNLNSWYYPKIPQKVHEDNINELSAVLDKVDHPTQIDTKLLTTIFQTSAYLDTFAEFLDRYMKQVCYVKGDKSISIYSELLFYGTTLENFKHILSSFVTNSSKLVHAKVSYYAFSFMKTDKAKPVLEAIANSLDLQSMYFIAVAVTFYDEIPIQIFKYPVEVQELVRMKFGEDVNNFIVMLSMVYLMDCIVVSLLDDKKDFGANFELLIDRIESYRRKIVDFLKKNTNFLKDTIWRMIGSRSKKLSALGRFVLSFLFSLSYDPETMSLMKANADLVSNIRKLSNSKLSHVQDTITRIFPTLQEGDKWRMLLTDFYEHKENVVNDVVKSAEKAELDSQPPIISSLVLTFLEKALEVKDIDLDLSEEEEEQLTEDERRRKERDILERDPSYQMIQGLLKEEAFHSVLQEVLATSRERRMHQGTIQGTIFLARFAKYMTCNGFIVGEDDKKKNTGAKSMWSLLRNRKTKANSPADAEVENVPKLVINPSDLVQMIEFICNENTRNRRAYKPRMYMLETLRHLIKCPTVYELLNTDKAFYERVKDICEDGMDMQFNRNAWRLFYQLIKYHNGTIDSMIKCNVMAQFVDLIGAKVDKSSAVTSNSVHYFNKIFLLPENTLGTEVQEDEDENAEKKRKSPTKIGYNVPSVAVKEKYSLSVKQLSDFIVNKQLYNIFHFVYSKLTVGTSQGMAFQSMAQLYRTLDSHSSTVNIARTFKKQKEYAAGLEKISEMHNGVTDTSNNE